MRKFLEACAAAALAAALCGGAFAQVTTSVPAGGASTTTTPAVPVGKESPEDLPPGAAPGGIQGQNIFEVKPEVKRDASNDPGYMEQNNGQRTRVQPGNTAPMWRGVQGGA